VRAALLREKEQSAVNEICLKIALNNEIDEEDG